MGRYCAAANVELRYRVLKSAGHFSGGKTRLGHTNRLHNEAARRR